jgi:hypothetical protein
VLIDSAATVQVGLGIRLSAKKVADEKLDLFYTLTRTRPPVTADEVVEGSCTLPIGVHLK